MRFTFSHIFSHISASSHSPQFSRISRSSRTICASFSVLYALIYNHYSDTKNGCFFSIPKQRLSAFYSWPLSGVFGFVFVTGSNMHTSMFWSQLIPTAMFGSFVSTQTAPVRLSFLAPPPGISLVETNHQTVLKLAANSEPERRKWWSATQGSQVSPNGSLEFRNISSSDKWRQGEFSNQIR